MFHIPTKLHQFLMSSFRDFLRTDTQTDRRTDRRRHKQYLLAACAQVIICTVTLGNILIVNEFEKNIIIIIITGRQVVVAL